MCIDIAWGLQKLGIILKIKYYSKFTNSKTSCLSKTWKKRFLDNKDDFWIVKIIFDIENWLWKLKIYQFLVSGIISIHKIQQFPWRPLLLQVLLCKNKNLTFFAFFFFAYRRHVEVLCIPIFPLQILWFVYPHYTSTFSQLKTSIRLSHVCSTKLRM